MSDEGNRGRGRTLAEPCPRRRALLTTALAGAVGALTGELAFADAGPDPRKLPPQIGDRLAYPAGDYDDRLVLGSELETGAAPLLVYPREAVSGIARERSRLNQILVLKLDPATLDPATRAFAADGIVAYSGICTHAACGVSEWDAASLRIICPCHASSFDPRTRAKVVSGPATRALPALPLRLVDDQLVVAAAFTAAVGATPS